MTWVYVFLIAAATSVGTQVGMVYLAKRAMRRMLTPRKTGKAAPHEAGGFVPDGFEV